MGYRKIGTISRTHGTAGAMILTQCTDASLALQSGTPVLIGFSANFAKSYILTSCESYKQSLIIMLKGVTMSDIDQLKDGDIPLPLIDDVILSTDIEKKQIVIRLIDGLTDLLPGGDKDQSNLD